MSAESDEDRKRRVAHEARVRRICGYCNLTLSRSRRQDDLAPDYRLYRLARDGEVIFSSVDLSEIEARARQEAVAARAERSQRQG